MTRQVQLKRLWIALPLTAFFIANLAYSAEAPDDWKKVVEAAKKEGNVVVGGPPTSVLRQKFKETF